MRPETTTRQENTANDSAQGRDRQSLRLSFVSNFSRAIRDEIVDFNPCSKFDQEPESKRERYLTPSEQPKLMEVLVDELAFLRAPIEVSLGTGVRNTRSC